MDPNTSISRLCLRESNQGFVAEGIKNKEKWEGPEFQDTASSGKEKEVKVFTFYRMEQEGERYFTPCYVGRLHAYDGEINLKYEKNLISSEFAVKLCLEYEEKNREKLDDVEPSVILGRSFMRLAKGIVDFENGIITIHPELDPFLDKFEETEKSEDDWDHLLDIDFGELPEIDEAGLPPFVCKIGKSKRNNKRALENFHLYYSDVGPSLCNGKPLTQEEAACEELAIDICKRFSILEEERPEKEDPGAFIIPIRLEEKIYLNALADTGSDINVMPYRIYTKLVGVTTIITKFLILDMPIDRDAPILISRGFLYSCGSILNTRDRITSTFNGVCHQTFRAAKTSLNTEESDNADEEDYGI
ncbi:hypothetical protein Tco_1201010 [Tanacetum coccineum]